MTYMFNWYKTYLVDAERRDVPILFLRFEDLSMNPEPELYKIMQFMLGVKDLTGTNAERRIKEVIAKGSSATLTYSLKDSTKLNNSNAKMYSLEQQAWIKDKFAEMLYFFGYARLPQDPENVTGYYEFDEPNETLRRTYKGYEAMNEQMLNWVCSMTDEELSHCQYQLSDPAKEVPIHGLHNNEQFVTPSHNFYEKKYYNRTF